MDGQRRDLAKILTAFIFLLGYIRFTHAADGDVRLRDGAANSGRVEIEYSNQYGTVCLDGFDLTDAHVVCRQLGFRYGALRVVLAAGFGFGQTGAGLDINVHSVNCAGDEANLAECPGVMWTGSCDSSRAAAVFCALPYYEGCYEKDTIDLIMDSSGTLSGSLILCRVFKNNFTSSSLVGGNLFCPDSRSEFGTKVDDSLCGRVCVNNPNQICGGEGNYRAVYSTRLGADGFSPTGDSSSITSPNYPASYDINDRQEWTVTLTSPQQVEFSFPAFDLLSGDVITISAGGVNETFPARRTWLSDSTSSFTVWFESGSTKGNGFILNYDVYVPPVTSSPPQPPATTQDQATQPPPPVTTADSSVVTTDGDTATTAAPPPPPPTTKGVAMSTAAPQQPSTGVVQPAASTGATPLATTSTASGQSCPPAAGRIETSWLQRDASGLLIINTGDPLPCDGSIVRVSFYALTTNPIEVSVWRRAPGNTYQLLDSVTLEADSSPSPVTATLSMPLLFREGDLLGFSFNALSPLVYSDVAPSVTEHVIFNHSDLPNFPGLPQGQNLELNGTNQMVVNRAYSFEVSLEDERCLYPSISNGNILPTGTNVLIGQVVTIQCDNGYEPQFTMATCLSNRTFNNDIRCNRIPSSFTSLTFTQFIILIVSVGVIFLLVLLSLCSYYFCSSKSPKATTQRDTADGAAVEGDDSYLLHINTIGTENGVDNSFFNKSTYSPSPVADNGYLGVPDPNANRQVLIEMPEISEEDTKVPEEVPEVPAVAASPAEVSPSPAEATPSPEQPTPELPAVDYDDEEEDIPPPPILPPPPPPPEDEEPFESASPVDDAHAEQPSSVLPNQDVLY